MNEPAIESAVHTTPPIISAATIPPVPFRPTATITTEARISVISVMPLTGFEPTMAIAFAATVVKRKAMTAVRMMATAANNRLPSITPNQKNKNVSISVMPAAIAMKRKGRSLLLLAVSPLVSVAFVASPTALLMTPHDLMMPMMPAIAIAPIPMLLPYDVKICSGDMSPTAVAMAGFHWFNTVSENNNAIPGTTSHHTNREPSVIIRAYRNPMM